MTKILRSATAALVLCAVSILFHPLWAAEAEEFVVGMGAAFSGPNARVGQEQLRGLQLWADEVNLRGGVAGRKVKIVHEDDTGDADAAQRYEKLVVEQKAAVLVGPYFPEATRNAAAVAERLAVPLLAPGPLVKAAWSNSTRHVFALHAPPDTYMESLLGVAKSKGLRRVALMFQNATYPREIADGVRARVNAYGMRLVLDQGYEVDAADLTGALAKLKQKRPDVLIVVSNLADALNFMRQAKEAKYWAKLMAFAIGANQPEFAAGIGADADGIIGASQWESALKLQGVTEFTKRYKLKYSVDAGLQAAGGYAAGQLIEAAARKAVSIERDRLRKAFSELDTFTVLGRYKVDASGWQVGHTAYLVQWAGLERRVVLPSEAAGGELVYPLKAWNKR